MDRRDCSRAQSTQLQTRRGERLRPTRRSIVCGCRSQNHLATMFKFVTPPADGVAVIAQCTIQ